MITSTSWDMRRQRSSKNTELLQLQKRLGQVESVITNLGSVSDNVEDINKKINSAYTSLCNGVTGVGQVNSTASALSGKKEKYADSHLMDSRDQLVSERRRINDRITSLQSEIFQLDDKIAKEEEE